MTNRSSRAFSASALAWRDAVAEARRAVEQAEEHGLGGGRERARLVRREGRIVHAVALLEHDQLAADDIAPRAAVVQAGREPGGVEPPLGDAIDQAFGVAEMGLWAEIRTRGHRAGH